MILNENWTAYDVWRKSNRLNCCRVKKNPPHVWHQWFLFQFSPTIIYKNAIFFSLLCLYQSYQLQMIIRWSMLSVLYSVDCVKECYNHLRWVYSLLFLFSVHLALSVNEATLLHLHLYIFVRLCCLVRQLLMN